MSVVDDYFPDDVAYPIDRGIWLVRGAHTPKGRYRACVMASEESEHLWYWIELAAYRVWFGVHPPCEDAECWCREFDGKCFEKVPKGTPGAVPGWHVEVRSRA